MQIKLIDRTNFSRDSLRDFRRYQEVKKVYRLKDGQLTLVDNPFTEDWDEARRIEKAEEILGGRFVTYCAFAGDRVVGVIMLAPQPNNGRLIIESFHVSGDCRRRGIAPYLKPQSRKRGSAVRMPCTPPAALPKKRSVSTRPWAFA